MGAPILHPALVRLSLPEPIFSFTPHEKPYETPGAKMRLAVAFGNAAKEPRTQSGNLEAFLAFVAAHSFGEPVSVLDVIRQFAYAYGGVHLGVPTSPFQRVVQRIGSVMTLDAVGWSSSLVGITRVTLEAIRPISDVLVARPYPTPDALRPIPSAADFQAMRERRRLD